ncbi:type II toxin-antitoxin system VapC family toxin [Candidatus Bathyarchaeota archaeon]|nr:type II toxin-antitoxin system VapC family toxin [Candidatus Bathyarchaeota archaeon]
MSLGERRLIEWQSFDTSALVKRYRKEVGSDVLDELFELKEHNFAISFWTILEFMVAFSTRMKRGELSKEALNILISRFLKDVLDRFAIISVNDELIASATSIAVRHALPSSDCLQLASVISLKHTLEPLEEKVVLICSDKDLCKAAKEEEIEVIDPEEKDALEIE